MAGDVFEHVKNDRWRARLPRNAAWPVRCRMQATRAARMSLEDFFARIEGGEAKTLNLIVRADMQGTLEPIVKSLNELANEEVTVKILQASIGDISESDVMLAEASDAVIIGFSVGVDKAAAVRADQSGVEIRHYEIIYKMIEDIEDAMKGMLEPIYKEVVVGHAQVLQLFKLRKGVRRRLHGQRWRRQARRAGQGSPRRRGDCHRRARRDPAPLHRRCRRGAHRATSAAST